MACSDLRADAGAGPVRVLGGPETPCATARAVVCTTDNTDATAFRMNATDIEDSDEVRGARKARRAGAKLRKRREQAAERGDSADEIQNASGVC